jgi:hypothetical protein
MAKLISFDDAKRLYVNRYTMEHVPLWAKQPCSGNGKYYAPQYRSDAEWYENTDFPPLKARGSDGDCFSANPTWPLGQWLDKEYVKGV